MKTASIALAALLTLSGIAFAGNKDERPVKTTAEPAKQEMLDPATTGSILGSDQKTTKSPRLGIDLDPFSFGSFH